MKYIIVLGVFICCAKQIYSDNPKVAAVKNFKVITGPEVYDKDIRPNLGENASVQVNITMHVTDYEFNPITRTFSLLLCLIVVILQEMTMVMYFRQKWTDPRLVSNTLTADVIGGKSIIERVWTPDTFFSNSLDVNIMKYPTRNLFAKVLHNGEVYYSERIKVVFRCGPQISIKSDECDLEIESCK
ncbi:unnamed protein product [Oppiella nova]|uniref:Neurotransmitter-gated ion-channel ligand-binding domain-containing protein n=1 Tax=Oppiella nova TaxID=334625 RepID=A0A7R9MGA8_9ACAR|nr:unnamed protein product [Oppiella nova]CAG2176705.1 unnamed protein product [Oppiella nova]